MRVGAKDRREHRQAAGAGVPVPVLQAIALERVMPELSLFGKLFGTGDNPPDATNLDGTSETALTRSLAALPPGEPGWVTFAEARNLFSTGGAEYAFGEMDKDGRRNIESFAAQHGSAINFMPNEQRVYFVRSHWGGWRQPGIPV